jgi:VWFA-related protein
VLFTDGVDTTSRYASYESNVRDAEELDALIYPVQYNTYDDQNGGGSGWPGGGRRRGSSGDVLGDILGGVFRGHRGRGSNGGGGRGGGGRGGAGSSEREYDVANRYLHDLAEKTGGRNYEADSTQNLAQAFANVADELRRQYTLGYYPKNPAQAGERRQIRVRVNEPNLAVRTRDSYVFNPAGATPDDTAARGSTPVLHKKLADVDVRRDFGRR